MTRTVICLSCATVMLAGLAFGQAGESKPAFEIADVHASRPVQNMYIGGSPLQGPAFRHGNYEIRYATMLDLVKTAYGVQAARVLAGPSWLEYDLFDVIAKAPAGTTVETARPMLQALLAERFKLVAQHDTRSLSAFALKAGRRPLLKPAAGEEDGDCKFTPPKPPAPGDGPRTTAIELLYSCHNMTMAKFATDIRNFAAATQYLDERVVSDLTELKGAWDFDFKYTPKGMVGPNGPLTGTITLFEAVEKLGLRLEAAEIPLPVIVVGSVERKPTPNPPNTAEVLHITPPPTEFDVATVKPTDPNSREMNFQIQPGGRVNLKGVPLKLLIQVVWNLSDEMLAGAPKWLETDRYDIVAKADVPGPEMEPQEVLPLLRSLITERFQLVSHMEDRAVNAYTLIAAKPKLKRADPASRTKWKEGPALDGKDPRDKMPILSRLVTVQNMTMADFAERLQQIAPGYIHTPVLDATGLEGGYDFTLSFSPAGAMQAGRGGRGGDAGAAPPPAEAMPSASDPSGAISLPEAIEKQLGLKLKEEKRPVRVLVIDRIDQKPVDN